MSSIEVQVYLPGESEPVSLDDYITALSLLAISEPTDNFDSYARQNLPKTIRYLNPKTETRTWLEF